MKTALRVAALTAAVVGILGLVAALAQTAETAKPIQVAQFAIDGKLQKPADLDSWVFSAHHSAWATTRARSMPHAQGSFKSC